METTTINIDPKRPGIVIFAAVLHFFKVALFGFLSLFCVFAMIFGTALGFDQYFREQMAHISPPNFSYGLTVIFGAALFVFLCFTVYFLSMAVGLLKGKKYAWYLQVALSTLGLLSFPLSFVWTMALLPLGTLLNIVILVFFFQPRVREFFKV